MSGTLAVVERPEGCTCPVDSHEMYMLCDVCAAIARAAYAAAVAAHPLRLRYADWARYAQTLLEASGFVRMAGEAVYMAPDTDQARALLEVVHSTVPMNREADS